MNIKVYYCLLLNCYNLGYIIAAYKVSQKKDADKACTLYGTDCYVPDHATKAQNKDIVLLMTTRNITNVCTKWVLEELQSWTWIDYTTGGVPGYLKKAYGCGFLDAQLDKLYSGSCTILSGYICQYSSTEVCSDPNRCTKIGTAAFEGFASKMNWFKACSSCRQKGGVLAILKETNIIVRLLNFVKSKEHLKYIDLFYIGLRSTSWVTKNSLNPDLFKLDNSLWAPGYPVDGRACSILQLRKSEVYLLSVDCNSNETFSVICFCNESKRYIFPEGSITKSTGPAQWSTEQPNITTTHKVNSTGKGMTKSSPLQLVLLTILIPFGIACIVVPTRIYMCRKRRHRRQCKESIEMSGRFSEDENDENGMDQLLKKVGQERYSRVSEDILSKDRQKLIIKHRKKLSQTIRIQEEGIQNFAREHLKLKDADCTVESILSGLQTNADFEEFCQALYKSNQLAIVGRYLVTQDDVNSARVKLARYYLYDFADIRLYSLNEEVQKVSVGEIFVPMTWKRYSYKQFHNEEELDSYTALFQKIQETKEGHNRKQLKVLCHGPVEEHVQSDSRIVLEGEAGVGKTTFVKRLCFLWAFGVSGSSMPHKSLLYKVINNYNFVIPIILRLVKSNETIFDMLYNQLGCLTVPEMSAFKKKLSTDYSSALLLLDGYDEIQSECKIVTEILKKNVHENLLCITTSRTYAVNQITQISSSTIDQRIKLLGFNDYQKQIYFIKCCEFFGKDKEYADRLFQFLQNERNDLLVMADIPIRCEIICVVWVSYGHLGETLADLYLLFITQLLYHMENKPSEIAPVSDSVLDIVQNNNKEPSHVLEKYHKVLMDIGCLANTWKSRRLCTVFTYDQMKTCLSDKDILQAKRIGLLTKTHPSNIPDRALWGFPHVTLHEFMTAYYLGHCGDTELEVFTAACQNVKVLQRSEVIFQFLVSKYPKTANQLLKSIIIGGQSKSECGEILKFVLKIYPYFCHDIKIPLPKYVDTSYCQEKEKDLNKLFQMDKDKNLQNLQQLIINDASWYTLLGHENIQNLQINLSDTSEKEQASQHFVETPKLEALFINGPDANIEDVDKILGSLSLERLQSLSIICKNTSDFIIKKFEKLSELNQRTFESNTRTSNIDKISLMYRTKLKKLTIISYCQPDLFTLETGDLSLRLHEITQTHLSKVTEKLQTPCAQCHVTLLDLSNNNLEECGEPLGEILVHIKTLRVLELVDCGIKKKTIKQMKSKMAGKKYSLMLLDLSSMYGSFHNNLSDCGTNLGEIITTMENLETLNMECCALTLQDLVDITQTLCLSDKIRTLNLWDNNDLRNATTAGAELLIKLTKLEAIKLGGIQYDNVNILCEAIRGGALRSLKILCMHNSGFQQGTLELLGKRLGHMPHLRIVDLKHFREGNNQPMQKSTDSYKFVFENISPSVQHLNMWTQDVNMSVTVILKNKENLNGLLTLNIWRAEGDLELLQEKLEELSPDIRVYNDANEDLWKTYVTDKQKEDPW